MHTLSGRRRFLQLAGLVAGAAVAEPLLPSAGALARAAAPEQSTGLVELQPVFSEAAFPERGDSRGSGGPNLCGASGIVASQLHPGVFWITRDGFGAGDPALLKYRSYLYAVRFDAASGQLRRWGPGVTQTSCDGYVKYLRVTEGGSLLAWGDIEDLALDPGQPGAAGTLWLGSIGNNAHDARPGRLHRLPEPDPERDDEVAVQTTVSFWSRPDHHGPQANFEALFVAGGVPYALVKSCPESDGMAPGQVLRLPAGPGAGGAVADAVPVARMQPAAGTGWSANCRPNGADLRGGELLLSTGSRWLRYRAAPGLAGDALVRDLAARPPEEWGWWQPAKAPIGNEAIGWLPAGSPGFLAVSEGGQLRWWQGGRATAASARRAAAARPG
jgi:hypothetical protein